MLSRFFILILTLLSHFSYALPDNKEIERYTSAAFMYMDLQDYKMALSMARAAVALSPDNPVTFIAANARATLGVAIMKENPDAVPGIEKNINQALRYYSSIGKKTSIDTFIIKNLQLVVESSLNNESIRISAALLDSLGIRQFSDPYYDIRSKFGLEKSHEFAYTAKKLLFSSQLSRNTLELPRDLTEQLAEKVVSVAENVRDAESIARAKGNLGIYYSSLEDRYIGSAVTQLDGAISGFDDLRINTPELKPLEEVYYDNTGTNKVFWHQDARSTFACIEIGSSGVKLSVLKYQRNSEGEYVFEVVEPSSDDTKFTNFTAPNLKSTIEKVKEFYDYVSTPNGKYKLATRRIFIAVSSGVNVAVGNNTQRMQMLTDLKDGIRKATNHPNDVSTLSDADEPKLTLLGVLPEESRKNQNDELYRHVLIDIGTGNTKGGYFGRDREQKIFNYFSSAWGLRKFEERLKSVPNERLYEEAQKLADSVMTNEITDMLSTSNVERKSEVVLNGGIFWAITTFTKPEEIVNDYQFTRLTLTDITTFKNWVRSSYKEMVESPTTFLSKVDAQNREKVLGIIDQVHKSFNERKLLIGAIFAEALIKQNNSRSSIPKVYRFAKYGNIGWPTGWIMKNIGLVEDDYKNVER